jgi:aspartyl-tRNA(Asn)/glutamyl-tRNA(Gln) amidotransferase subunit C
MALDKTEVEKIAHLARLHISESETHEVTTRITDILALIDQMQSVDTDAIDKITEENQRDKLQQLAPASEDGLYLVPKVLD